MRVSTAQSISVAATQFWKRGFAETDLETARYGQRTRQCVHFAPSQWGKCLPERFIVGEPKGVLGKP